MKLHEAPSLLVAAVAVGAIVVASAPAQDVPESQDPAAADLSASVRVTPSKAGTKQSPQGVTITAASRITTAPGFDPPIVTGIDLFLGEGFSWNAGEYVKCSEHVLDREGPGGCPNESIMGSVIATARAGSLNTKPEITLVNGGETRLFAFTRFDYPARVQETIAVKTADTTGRWHYKGTLRVPKNLQVVAGIPIQTTRMKLTIGGRPHARDYITTTSCPQGGWKYQATTHYLYDATGQTGRDTVSGTIT